MHYVLLQLNANRIRFAGVRFPVDDIDGAPVYLDGDVELFQIDEILDSAGAPVGGQPWPLALAYEAGSQGAFSAVFDKAIDIHPEDAAAGYDGLYRVNVTLNDGPGRDGAWEIAARALVRDGVLIR